MENFIEKAWDAGARTWEDLVDKLDEYKDESEEKTEETLDATRNKAKELSDSGMDFPNSRDDLKNMFAR